MHKISLAPVLSATFSRDSCWIISLDLPYFAFSTIWTRRQRLVALTGRVSITTTRSPMPAALFSSCTLSLVVWVSTLPYSRCLIRSSTATTTVLSILSLTTRPSRTLRRPRSLEVWATSATTASASLVSANRSWLTASCSLTVCSLISGTCRLGHSGLGVRILHDAQVAFLQHGVEPGDVLADLAEPTVRLQLPGGGLEPQREQLFLQFDDLRVELVAAQRPQLGGLHGVRHQFSPASR